MPAYLPRPVDPGAVDAARRAGEARARRPGRSSATPCELVAVEAHRRPGRRARPARSRGSGRPRARAPSAQPARSSVGAGPSSPSAHQHVAAQRRVRRATSSSSRSSSSGSMRTLESEPDAHAHPAPRAGAGPARSRRRGCPRWSGTRRRVASRARQQRDLGVVAVRAVHDRACGAERAGAVEQLDRPAAVLAPATPRSRAAARRRAGAAAAARRRSARRSRSSQSAGTARTECGAAPTVTSGRPAAQPLQRLEPLQVGLDRRVAEAPLARVRLAAPRRRARTPTSSSTIRRPTSSAAAQTASASALGRSYGVPSGWWCT